MLKDEDIMPFFAKKGKKKSSLPEERQGIYDGHKCDARVWKEKKGTGGLGYDNIQCSSKKVDGQCFCKRHSKAFSEGVLWLGKVTDPRPENPTKPDGTLMGWCTDQDGNDVVKEKKARKKSSEKKPKKKKVVKEKSEEKIMEEMTVEELQELLAKKKASKEEEPKEEEPKEEEKKEVKEAWTDKEGSEGGKGAGCFPEKDEEESGDEDDESDMFEVITVDGVEYQHNKEDHVVIRVDDFEEVGKWNCETGEIDFDDDE